MSPDTHHGCAGSSAESTLRFQEQQPLRSAHRPAGATCLRWEGVGEEKGSGASAPRPHQHRLLRRWAPRRWAPLLCVAVLLCQNWAVGASQATDGGNLEDDEVYGIDDDSVEQSSLGAGRGTLLDDDAEADGVGGGGEASLAEEPPLTEVEKKAMNKSHAALLKVISLSWPSEGAFGAKVARGLPADQPRRYSWLRAQRKAFQVLLDSDMKARSKAPSEEVLLALGYRYLHGVGTRRNCQQALECYNAVADSVSHYMEENDSREQKLDLGLMRISLSEIDGILGEDLEDTGEALEFDMLNAQGGDTWAQKEVGWRSLVGRGLDEDHGQALQHLEAAAAVGDPDAQHNLGYMYMNGLGVERNMTKAKTYFDEAAKHNVTAAFNALGYMYYRGAGVTKNTTLGEHYLKLAADRDDADAAFNLAALYQDLDRNMSRAFPFLEQAADAGFWRALLAIADVHDMGIERPRNCTAAVMALKKMVETHGGVANELRAAVEAYQQGNTAEALSIFCELAEQGVEVAQSNCAWLYLKGVGLAKPVNATLRLLAVRRMFERAGQQGGGDAHLRLGDLEWSGLGKEANMTAAAEHYLIAAARRSQQASFALGYMHQFGKGVARNLTLARRFYKKSGNRDHFTRYPSNIALLLLAAQIQVEGVLEGLVSLQWGGRPLLAREYASLLQPQDEAQLAAVSCMVLGAVVAGAVLILATCSALISRIDAPRDRHRTEQGAAGQRRVPDIAAWLHADEAFQQDAANRRRW
jgi:TPR repeat protein